MTQRDLNVPASSLAATDSLYFDGGKILYSKLFDQIYADVQAAESGFQEIRINETADLIANFAINQSGQYVIPDKTIILQGATQLIWDRPALLEGDFTHKGLLYTANTIATVVQTFTGTLFQGSNTKYLMCERIQYVTAGMPTTPNLSATLFNINQGTNQANWTGVAFLWDIIAAGYGNIGTIGGFDILYLRELIQAGNLNGLNHENCNKSASFASIWQQGLGAGTIATYNNVKEIISTFSLTDANPTEKLINIIDTPVFQKAKFVSGIFSGGNTDNAFSGVNQNDPRVTIGSFSPIPPSTLHATLQVIAPSAVSETPLATDNFYPISNDLELNASVRIEKVGTGTTARYVVKSKEKMTIQVIAIAAFTPANTSVQVKLAVGKWNNGSLIGDNAVLTTDTTNWELLTSQSDLSTSGTLRKLTAINNFEVQEDDYFKIYFASSTTADIDVDYIKFIISPTNV